MSDLALAPKPFNEERVAAIKALIGRGANRLYWRSFHAIFDPYETPLDYANPRNPTAGREIGAAIAAYRFPRGGRALAKSLNAVGLRNVRLAREVYLLTAGDVTLAPHGWVYCPPAGGRNRFAVYAENA